MDVNTDELLLEDDKTNVHIDMTPKQVDNANENRNFEVACLEDDSANKNDSSQEKLDLITEPSNIEDSSSPANAHTIENIQVVHSVTEREDEIALTDKRSCHDSRYLDEIEEPEVEESLKKVTFYEESKNLDMEDKLQSCELVSHQSEVPLKEEVVESDKSIEELMTKENIEITDQNISYAEAAEYETNLEEQTLSSEQSPEFENADQQEKSTNVSVPSLFSNCENEIEIIPNENEIKTVQIDCDDVEHSYHYKPIHSDSDISNKSHDMEKNKSVKMVHEGELNKDAELDKDAESSVMNFSQGMKADEKFANVLNPKVESFEHEKTQPLIVETDIDSQGSEIHSTENLCDKMSHDSVSKDEIVSKISVEDIEESPQSPSQNKKDHEKAELVIDSEVKVKSEAENNNLLAENTEHLSLPTTEHSDGASVPYTTSVNIENDLEPSSSDLKDKISAEIALLEKQAKDEAESKLEDEKENFSKHCADGDGSESNGSMSDCEERSDNYIDISRFLINFESMDTTAEEDDKRDQHFSTIEEIENESLNSKSDVDGEDIIEEHARESEHSCSDNEDAGTRDESTEKDDSKMYLICGEEEKLNLEHQYAVQMLKTKLSESDINIQSPMHEPSIDFEESQENSVQEMEELREESENAVYNMANFEVIDETVDDDKSKVVNNKDIEAHLEEMSENKSEVENKSADVQDALPKEDEKKSKKIIKITCDDLPKSSKATYKRLEIPGEEIEGGEFTRVVIIGSTYLSAYNDSWPTESKIKPFFLGKSDLTIQQYYKEFCDHPYLTGSKKIFILFVIGLNDILIFRKYKARDCLGDHAEIKFPRCGKASSPEFFQILTDKMHSIKEKLEANESLSVSFSYIPKVNFIEDINNLFIASRSQNENCSCCYNVTKSDYAAINAKFNCSRESFNQFIFSRHLNEVRDKGFFEFLPLHLTYMDRKWTVHKDRIATKIDGMSLDARLKDFIFNADIDSIIILSSKILENDMTISREQLLGKMCFRIIIIGDTWLQSVLESWSWHYKIKPFFYCKSDMTLLEIKKIILSLVRDNANTLVITTVSSGDLFSLESHAGCEGHEPLLFPVPKKEICEAPLRYANQLCKKIDLFQTEMKELRKYCKIVFMTSYPVIFELYYKHLTEHHEIETELVKHTICERLVGFHECVDHSNKMKRCLRAINSHLVEVNMENGLHTCDIYSLATKLYAAQACKFLFPTYVPQKSPPQFLKKKLATLTRQYVESTHILYLKRKFSFKHIQEAKSSEITRGEFSVTKETGSNDSVTKESTSDKTLKSDSKKSSSTKKKEKDHEDKDDSAQNAYSKSGKHSADKSDIRVSKAKHSSNSDAPSQENELIVKSLTCSSHHKSAHSGIARYPEKFYERKHSSSRHDVKYPADKEHYSDRSPKGSSVTRSNEVRYPKDIYPHRSRAEPQKIPHEVRYPLPDTHEEEYSEINRHKYRESYRRSQGSPHDHKKGPDYHPDFSSRRYDHPDRYHTYWRSRSRSPVQRPKSRSSQRLSSRSKRYRSRSKSRNRSPSNKKRRSCSMSRSKYNFSQSRERGFRSSRKKSKSYSPQRSSRRDGHSSAKEEAISNLWEIHSRECEMYRRNPEAHPDYEKVKRMWYEVMSSQGLNPYDVNLEVHWHEYWLKKMENIFKDNWEDKKSKCLALLSSKLRRSRSSSSSSQSSYSDHESRKSGKHRHKKKKSKSKKTKSKKKSKRDSFPADSHAKSTNRILEDSLSRGKDPNLLSVEELESRINDFMMKSRPGSSLAATSADFLLPSVPARKSVDAPSTRDSEHDKLLDVTTILAQISDRFGALGMSLSVLHKKVVDTLTSGQNPLQCIDEDAKMLLELIGDKIKRLLEDSSLTLVQRAIIQEANDRLFPFLESLDKKNETNFGLDLDIIAKSTLGMQVSEIVNFIKTALTYKRINNVSNEDLMKIYVEVKAAQMKFVMHAPTPTPVTDISKDLSSSAAARPSISNLFPNFSLSGTSLHPPHSYSSSSEMKNTRSAQIKSHFLSLSMNEKLKKFAMFHTLPFEEKSFLLSHLDELEKTDKGLAQSLRFMIMQKN